MLYRSEWSSRALEREKERKEVEEDTFCAFSGLADQQREPQRRGKSRKTTPSSAAFSSVWLCCIQFSVWIHANLSPDSPSATWPSFSLAPPANAPEPLCSAYVLPQRANCLLLPSGLQLGAVRLSVSLSMAQVSEARLIDTAQAMAGKLDCAERGAKLKADGRTSGQIIGVAGSIRAGTMQTG